MVNKSEYKVHVKPGTSREKIVENSDGSLIVYLRAKAHDGEANDALIKLLAKHFHVAKSYIVIKRGAKSKEKIISLL